MLIHRFREAFAVHMPDGGLYQIEAGRGGKGINITPIADVPQEPRRGRTPNPETIFIRNKVDADRERGELRPAAHYVVQALDAYPAQDVRSVRAAVYREMARQRRLHPSLKKRQAGRVPDETTLLVREAIEQDAAAGNLRGAIEYMGILRAKRPNASDAAIRQVVYREIKRATA